jgi:hypothetical protein
LAIFSTLLIFPAPFLRLLELDDDFCSKIFIIGVRFFDCLFYLIVLGVKVIWGTIKRQRGIIDVYPRILAEIFLEQIVAVANRFAAYRCDDGYFPGYLAPRRQAFQGP